MIAIGKTTNEFIEIITPIRRLKTDISYYFSIEPSKKEIFVFIYLLLLII